MGILLGRLKGTGIRREVDRVSFTDFWPEFFMQRGGTKEPPV